MKKKILAGVALAVILAMESVTAFATEQGTGLSAEADLLGDYLYGAGGTQTVEDNTLNNVNVEELTKTVEIEINVQTGDVESKNTGMIFRQDTVMELKLIDKGELTGAKNVDLTIDIRVDDTEKNKKIPLTDTETTSSVAVTEKAIEYGRKTDSNLICSYTVSFKGETDDSNRDSGNDSTPIDRNDIEFQGEGLKNVKQDCATIVHVTDWGVTENLGAEKTPNGFIPARNPSSRSPFILLVFDSPVPGLTTDVDYSEATAIGTVSGATSPKTAQTYPYATTTAVVALTCVIACTKKIAKR